MDKEQLVSPEDESFLWEVLYNNDYMTGCTNQSALSFFVDIQSKVDINGRPSSFFPPPGVNHKLETNSIPLHPAKAGLAWYTSIDTLRQNKHWKSALSITSLLLKLFSIDETAVLTVKHRKKSYVDVTKAEIGLLHHSWSRFNAYLYPAADHSQLELIGAVNALIFIFDDIWEMNNEETIRAIRTKFVSWLSVPNLNAPEAETPLQTLIGIIVQRFYNDYIREGPGSAGKEIVDLLIDFCNHPPPKDFKTLREFLDYRIGDAAVMLVFSCIKFSLGSTVDISSPRIARILSLASDHVCYANDLGSFAKEKDAYNKGDIVCLINTVDMVQKALGLPDDDSAKSATLAFQLQVESHIMLELSALRESVEVTQQELEFVECVVHMIAGNVFTSVVMSRYGGEESRICW